MALTCSGSVQSHPIAITFLPVFSASSSAVFFASSRSRSTIATSAPASAKAVAVLFPMPLAPPVTNPFLPSNRIFSIIPILHLLFHVIYFIKSEIIPAPRSFPTQVFLSTCYQQTCNSSIKNCTLRQHHPLRQSFFSSILHPQADE